MVPTAANDPSFLGKAVNLTIVQLVNVRVSKLIQFRDFSIEPIFETVCPCQAIDAPQDIDFVNTAPKRKVFGI
jgi:hypothetical protein